jgi:trehalose-6-phosphate synthase
MQRMRKVVREHNIYRWASTLIAELCEVRLDQPANGLDSKLRASAA